MPWVFSPPNDTGPGFLDYLRRSLRDLRIAFTQAEQNLAGRRIMGVNSASPSVALARVLLSANTATTNVTAFADGSPGQHITLIFGDANTTLVHGASLQLAGGVNFTGTVGATRQFVTYDGATFYQVQRG